MQRRFLFAAILTTTLIYLEPNANAQLGGLFSPSVESISTDDLATQLKARKQQEKAAEEAGKNAPTASFVLVDVRSDDETAVSMIPGAITREQFEKEIEKHRSKLIIPYCTVGGRSGRYAKELANRKFKVKNYSDSILGWVGKELPLVTLDGKPTKRVHTYSDRYKIPPGYEQVTR